MSGRAPLATVVSSLLLPTTFRWYQHPPEVWELAPQQRISLQLEALGIPASKSLVHGAIGGQLHGKIQQELCKVLLDGRQPFRLLWGIPLCVWQ